MIAARSYTVVELLACFAHAGRAWLVLELCELGSVSDLISLRGAPLSEPMIAAVCAGALKALDHLHNCCSVVHRDLKGGNLLLTSSLVIKLADFGVSHQLRNGEPRKGTIIGSPLYMPPELIEEGEASCARPSPEPLACLLLTPAVGSARRRRIATGPFRLSTSPIAPQLRQTCGRWGSRQSKWQRASHPSRPCSHRSTPCIVSCVTHLQRSRRAPLRGPLRSTISSLRA